MENSPPDPTGSLQGYDNVLGFDTRQDPWVEWHHQRALNVSPMAT